MWEEETEGMVRMVVTVQMALMEKMLLTNLYCKEIKAVYNIAKIISQINYKMQRKLQKWSNQLVHIIPKDLKHMYRRVVQEKLEATQVKEEFGEKLDIRALSDWKTLQQKYQSVMDFVDKMENQGIQDQGENMGEILEDDTSTN